MQNKLISVTNKYFNQFTVDMVEAISSGAMPLYDLHSLNHYSSFCEMVYYPNDNDAWVEIIPLAILEEYPQSYKMDKGARSDLKYEVPQDFDYIEGILQQLESPMKSVLLGREDADNNFCSKLAIGSAITYRLKSELKLRSPWNVKFKDWFIKNQSEACTPLFKLEVSSVGNLKEGSYLFRVYAYMIHHEGEIIGGDVAPIRFLDVKVVVKPTQKCCRGKSPKKRDPNMQASEQEDESQIEELYYSH